MRVARARARCSAAQNHHKGANQHMDWELKGEKLWAPQWAQETRILVNSHFFDDLGARATIGAQISRCQEQQAQLRLPWGGRLYHLGNYPSLLGVVRTSGDMGAPASPRKSLLWQCNKGLPHQEVGDRYGYSIGHPRPVGCRPRRLHSQNRTRVRACHCSPPTPN